MLLMVAPSLASTKPRLVLRNHGPLRRRGPSGYGSATASTRIALPRDRALTSGQVVHVLGRTGVLFAVSVEDDVVAAIRDGRAPASVPQGPTLRSAIVPATRSTTAAELQCCTKASNSSSPETPSTLIAPITSPLTGSSLTAASPSRLDLPMAAYTSSIPCPEECVVDDVCLREGRATGTRGKDVEHRLG